MALNRVCSEEFSFPLLPSQVSDSPSLWKHSPESFRRGGDHNRGLERLVVRKNDQSRSFSYVERRSLCIDRTEEKMDMLWEDLNEELPPRRSQSLRIEHGGVKRSSLLSEETSVVAVGCGRKLTKKKKKKKSSNVVVLMRVLKKLLVLRSSSQRSPAKTHPR